MKKRLIIRSLIGLAVGTLAVHAITLFVNYISRGEILICMPQLIETVAKAGIAVGVDGLFMETHEDPSVAKSDGANMLKLDLLEGLLTKLVRIRQVL